MQEAWKDVAKLARGQEGVFSRAQALDGGMTRTVIDRKVANNEWESPLHGVYQAISSPRDSRSMIRAVSLWLPDAVASHLTAAHLHELDVKLPNRLEFTSQTSIRAPKGVKLYRRCLADHHVVQVDGVRVTTLPRMMLDLAAAWPSVGETLLDQALRNRRLGLADLEEVLAHCGRGVPGSTRFRAWVALRQGDGGRAESWLERRFLALFRRAGLPRPELQYNLIIDGRRMRLDMAYPRQQVCIEIDGFAHHGGRKAWARDADRRNRLVRAGWVPFQATAEHLQAPDSLVEAVRDALSPRRHPTSRAELPRR